MLRLPSLTDIRFDREDLRGLLQNKAFLHLVQFCLEREQRYIELLSNPLLPSEQRAFFCGQRAGLMEFIENGLSVFVEKSSPTLAEETNSEYAQGVEVAIEEVQKYLATYTGIKADAEN